MRSRSARAVRLFVPVEPLEARCLLSVGYNTNLITNPGAESFSGTADGIAVVTPTGWTANGSGGPTVCPYSSGYGATIGMPQPPGGGGSYFFAGGKTTSEGDFFQTIDLSSITSAINDNLVGFTLSGDLGGNGNQNDNATVFVNFNGSEGLVGQDSIGPVLASDRNNTTGWVFKSFSGTIPSGATSVQVQIHFEYSSGTYTDAFADDLSLVLSEKGGNISGTATGAPSFGEEIYLDSNNNDSPDAGEFTTITSSTGAYSFTNVPPGNTIIREIPPDGYIQTSPANDYGIHVTVPSGGGNLTSENFTVEQLGGSITGTVTGAPAGETVYLDANNDSKLDDGELSETTSSSGTYAFYDTPPGAYIIRQVLPAGYTQVSPANGYGIHITVAGGSDLTGENFTDEKTPTGGSISGTVSNGKAGETVYLDANNNSKLDSGELSTTTNSSGGYTFSNVPAGAYIIRQVLPSGYEQVNPANGYGIHITVASGGMLSDENFVDLATGTASIAGTVFNDANGDGKQDDGEGGLSGWTVYLDLDNSDAYETGDPTATTDASGSYQFTGLGAGTYIIRVERPSNYSQTTPANNYGQHITVASGQKATGVLFGEEIIS